MSASSEAVPVAPPAPGTWGWFVVAALVVLELVTLTSYSRREIEWAAPGYFDQPGYLAHTYAISHDARTRGLLAATRAHLAKPHAAGVLYPVQGAFHGAVLGPGRFAALSVNFAHLVAFQCALVAVLVWLTRNWWVGFCGFGLTLALKTLYQPAGGAHDFRMDFASFCLFGVFLCALVRSRLCLTPRGAVAVGAVGAVLVLFRFITAVYLTGIMGLLGAGALAARAAASDPGARAVAARRLRGWAVAVAVLAVGALPVLVSQRKTIYQYYVVGHVTSSEKDIRAAEEGLRVWADAAAYYPRSVVRDHAGRAWCWAAGAVLAFAVLGRLGARARTPGGARRAVRLVLPVAALGFVVPFAVLNVNAVKSPVVAIVLLPALLFAALAPLVALVSAGAPAWAARGAGTAALLMGGLAFLDGASRPSHNSVNADDARASARLIEDVIAACHQKGTTNPELFFDANGPEFGGDVYLVMEFERHGRWRAWGGGPSIFAGDPDEHLKRLERSDVVVLGGPPKGAFRYPYDDVLTELRPRLRAYCEANLARVGEYRVAGRTLTAYVRGALAIEGLTTDGWITADGARLVGTLADLKGCERVELRREESPNYLGSVPAVSATVSVGDSAPRPLRATASDDLRAVFIEWDATDARPGDTAVTITVTFGAHFVPRDKGIGSDVRELVMRLGSKPRAHLHREVAAPGKW